MDFKTLSPEKRNALLDLLALGMYADGHLARVEDARIERVLHGMGWTAKSDRDRELDAAVTRVRKHLDSKESVAAHANELAAVFTSRTERQDAMNALEEVVRSDNKVAPGEKDFLEVARRAFI